MDIVAYQPEHLDTFKPGYWDRETTALVRVTPEWAGKAVSLREDGRTLGIVGVTIPGRVALVWAVLSDELRGRPLTLCRIAKASLPNIRSMPGVERVDIDVDLDFVQARRFAEWLGFKGRRRNSRWPGQDRKMQYGGT